MERKSFGSICLDEPLPLAEYVCSFSGVEAARFCTPGHKGSFSFLHSDDIKPLLYDIADDVACLPQKIRESEDYAARIYGSVRTFYLVNGSTAGVLAMFLTALKPGEKIVMARNFHRSALSGLVLSGAEPVYASCEMADGGIPLNVTADSIKTVLDENPDAKAVFITSPSYWGICADTKAIAALCRERGVALLADEAWGAHLPFGGGFPPSAISPGADLVVQSAHKTLPCLTGASLLHICSSRFAPARVEESLALIQTTSPNLLFYLSLEKAIWTMKSRGDKILGKAAYDAAQLRNLININSNRTGFQDIYKIAELCGFGVDPLKAAFFTNPAETGITGIELSEILSGDYGIIPEMSDFNSILFLLTGWETGENVKKLENALNRILSDNLKDGLSGRVRQKPCDYSSQAKKSCYLPPVIAVTPRVAHFFLKKQAEFEDCEGRICGVPVIPYPPGIPFLMPGEIIDREALSFLKNFISAGGIARGVENCETGIYLTILDE